MNCKGENLIFSLEEGIVLHGKINNELDNVQN